jgi:aspartate/methionine/tyrosine aminotransferase
VADLLCLNPESIATFCKLNLGYTETPGSLYLRQKISDLYQTLVPKNVLVHSGAQEAIFLFLQSFLSAGDHVIVQTPCYQSFLSVPQNIGCSVSEWEIAFDDKWHIDLENLEKLVSDKTKLICINSPNNPTGYHFSQEELSTIISIARKHGIVIFSDEVYQNLEQEQKDFLPAVGDIFENGVSLNVISKAYGLAGLRIGWVATSRLDILNKMAVLKDYTSICNNVTGEFLVVLALNNAKTLLSRNLQIIKRNLIIAETFFSEWKEFFRWQKPNAGPLTFVKMLTETDSNSFINRLLDAKKVLLLPGELYDRPGFFRMGFGRKNFPDALEKFSEFLRHVYY